MKGSGKRRRILNRCHFKEDFMSQTEIGPRVIQLFRFDWHWLHCRGLCDVEILQINNFHFVVIVSEPHDNPGMSVTNGYEYIAQLLCDKFGVLKSSEVNWFEAYAETRHRDGTLAFPATLDRVTLTWRGNGSVGVDWERVPGNGEEKLKELRAKGIV
jgi:hypothetical protein